MTFTEFIKAYTPDYKEREREFIAEHVPGSKSFGGRLRQFRERLFPEALETYTSEIIREVKPVKYEIPDSGITIIEEKAPE